MREALAVIGEEGLEKLWAKHKKLHHELWAGLKEMGLEPFVEDEAQRLVTVNCIKVSAGSPRKSITHWRLQRGHACQHQSDWSLLRRLQKWF